MTEFIQANIRWVWKGSDILLIVNEIHESEKHWNDGGYDEHLRPPAGAVGGAAGTLSCWCLELDEVVHVTLIT